MTTKTYMLRTCSADMTSHGGFRWPESGPVAAPDWSPVAECGGGLHGLPWGEGDGGLLDWSPGAKWLVVEYNPDQAVDLGGKIKIPSGVVVHCGDRASATQDIIARGARGAVVGAMVTAGAAGTAVAGDGGTATAGHGGTATAGAAGTATAGDRGTATAGYKGTATAGDRGTATAGYKGTATAGAAGTATAGHGGTATAGAAGTATAGDGGTATAGYKGTATAGDRGTATAGAAGTATAGHGGTATAGYKGTATAGHGGTATAGAGGIIVVEWFDGSRKRLAVGYVGEDGIKPGVAYRCDRSGRFVEATKKAAKSKEDVP